MTRYRTLLLLILLLTPALLLSADDTGRFLEEAVVEKKLPNGITLLMINRGYAPTLAFEVSFSVGSADESYDTAGTAHLLEHMLFKGTDRIGTRNWDKEKPVLERIEVVGETLDRLKRENPANPRIPDLEKELEELQRLHSEYVDPVPYSRLYKAQGGVGFNASTSRDRTAYYIQLPSEKLRLWAETETERLRNPVLREFYLERNNVIEERLMRYDSRGEGLLYERFNAVAYMAHPYRHPTIGWKTIIPFLSIKDVRSFYNRYYIPSRMTIAIVGKQDTRETFRIINETFGSLPAKPDPGRPLVKEVEQMGERRFSISFREKPQLIMGWHKPAAPHHDDYALDLAAELLGGSTTSWLHRTLVLESNKATEVVVWNGSPGARYDNQFVIFAAPAPGVALEDLEQAIYAEMEAFREAVTDEMVRDAKRKMTASFIFGMDSNKSLAHILSYYNAVLGDWRYASGYARVLREIEAKDLQAAMARYCVSRNRTVGYLHELSDKDTKE